MSKWPSLTNPAVFSSLVAAAFGVTSALSLPILSPAEGPAVPRRRQRYIASRFSLRVEMRGFFWGDRIGLTLKIKSNNPGERLFLPAGAVTGFPRATVLTQSIPFGAAAQIQKRTET